MSRYTKLFCFLSDCFCFVTMIFLFHELLQQSYLLFRCILHLINDSGPKKVIAKSLANSRAIFCSLNRNGHTEMNLPIAFNFLPVN